MGTPWEIDLEGAILFFEDTHTPPYYLEDISFSSPTPASSSRWRASSSADGEVGLRRPAAVSDWARSRTIEDVLEERLGSLGVPAIYGLPLGHTKHLAALPLGVICTLDADARTLTVETSRLFADRRRVPRRGGRRGRVRRR